MLPGTELAFAGNVKYQGQWLWPKVIESRVGKFSVLIHTYPSAITPPWNFQMAVGCS